jgi:hypothetical protein
MRRPQVSKSCFQSWIEDQKIYMQGNYNKIIFTNKTIKKPIGCPNGKSHCSMCRQSNGKGNQKKKFEYLRD